LRSAAYTTEEKSKDSKKPAQTLRLADYPTTGSNIDKPPGKCLLGSAFALLQYLPETERHHLTIQRLCEATTPVERET
jgi:hypothetical protein